MLETVLQYGTGKAAAIGQFAAGKTGTTSNYGDAWFVGWNSKYTVAVWVGYPNKLVPMTTAFDGGPVLGGTYPALIWHDFMIAAIGIEKEREESAAARAAGRAAAHGSQGSSAAPASAGAKPTGGASGGSTKASGKTGAGGSSGAQSQNPSEQHGARLRARATKRWRAQVPRAHRRALHHLRRAPPRAVQGRAPPHPRRRPRAAPQRAARARPRRRRASSRRPCRRLSRSCRLRAPFISAAASPSARARPYISREGGTQVRTVKLAGLCIVAILVLVTIGSASASASARSLSSHLVPARSPRSNVKAPKATEYEWCIKGEAKPCAYVMLVYAKGKTWDEKGFEKGSEPCTSGGDCNYGTYKKIKKVTHFYYEGIDPGCELMMEKHGKNYSGGFYCGGSLVVEEELFKL